MGERASATGDRGTSPSALPAPLLELLAEVGARNRVWRELRGGLAERYAIDFNMFDFLRTDELGLSAVLRWLLDPGASHGQRDLFLRLFLSSFEIRHVLQTCSAEAETEVATDGIAAKRRRLDVHVRCGEFILAIENKPYAGWQHRQVRDYLDHLQAVAPDRHCLVLLKSEDEPVPDHQLSPQEAAALTGEGRLVDSNYSHLKTWVRACVRECHAARVRAMLEEFADFIEREFEGDAALSENGFLFEALRSQPERLRAAMELIAVGDDLMETIFEDMEAALEPLALERGWSTDWEEGHGAPIDRSACALVVDFGDERLWFALVGDYSGNQGYIGLVTKEKSGRKPLAAETMRALDRGLGASGRSESRWLWWRHLTPSDVGAPPEMNPAAALWMAMNDRQAFAERMIGWVEAAHKALEARVR
ncbi:MAG TPA: PD-(D/E)XK nuclease family protein [Allosphingosinicella sp.]|jgi:hypothetical protein|nr:PD-(D/E)XK nuclease family protein [Allosphingosinicella sp.]